MPIYKAPIDDYKFLMHEVFDYSKLAELPGFEEISLDLIDQVAEETAKIVENEIFPLNQSSDHEGCHFHDGEVKTPKGFKEVYEKFKEGGWIGLACAPEYGGQGFPKSVGYMFEEFMDSGGLAFGMYIGLTVGAYRAMVEYADEALKQKLLPKMVSGEWSGTMCLTEAHCGTDLGLCKTKAAPQGDGSYLVTGTKIFITSGEHDLTSNIIHLVLARTPDAPEGIKGISLFAVPKFKINEDGSVGERNGVRCGSIEDKMGLKGSATCVINFDGAKGWLVGELNKGMQAMFVMMNAERLSVGLQGLGLAEVSYQNAVAYAKDRLQGRSLSGVKMPNKPADPILYHLDVRKNLLMMRAFIEGARALSCWTGYHLDVMQKHQDPHVKKDAADLVALMTPIIKGFFTDLAFESTNMGVQVFGGHGYIKEYGMEQYVRDARITQIYEGTNGIQAMDLLGRKMPEGMGRLLRQFFHPASRLIEEKQSEEHLEPFLMPFVKAYSKLQQVTAVVAQKAMKDPEEVGAAATDYLHLFGYTSLAFMWLKMIDTVHQNYDKHPEKRKFYDTKLKTAKFFFDRMLPKTDALFNAIMSGAGSMMAFEFEEF